MQKISWWRLKMGQPAWKIRERSSAATKTQQKLVNDLLKTLKFSRVPSHRFLTIAFKPFGRQGISIVEVDCKITRMDLTTRMDLGLAPSCIVCSASSCEWCFGRRTKWSWGHKFFHYLSNTMNVFCIFASQIQRSGASCRKNRIIYSFVCVYGNGILKILTFLLSFFDIV